jgi:hypothetical protein
MSQLSALDTGFSQLPGEPTGTTGHLGAAEAAYAARILAGLFGSTEPLGGEEASEAVEVLSGIPGGSDFFSGDAEGFRGAWNDRRHLYCNSQESLSLEESVYKCWTTDKSHPLAGKKGFAWGEPAVHMAEVLSGFGMAFDPETMTSPDHLSVLLEFLAFLIENRPRNEITAFCADHLNWLADLKREARLNDLGTAFVETLETAERLITMVASQ